MQETMFDTATDEIAKKEKQELNKALVNMVPLASKADDIFDIVKNRKPGLPTGYDTLDNILFGLQPGYHLIAARPSIGKTTLLLNMATNMSVLGHKPLVYSIEMAELSLLDRVLCSEAMVGLNQIRSRDEGFEISQETLTAIGEAQIRLAKSKMVIDYTVGLTGKKLKWIVESLYKLGKMPDAIFIDYIQYMQSGNAKSDIDKINENSQIIKDLTKIYEIPIVVAAQLNRGAEQGEGKDLDKTRPRLSDLKGSGKLEEDADTVIFLHRDRNPPDGTIMTGGEIIIAKNRNGETKIIPCDFFLPYFSISETKTIEETKNSDDESEVA